MKRMGQIIISTVCTINDTTKQATFHLRAHLILEPAVKASHSGHELTTSHLENESR